MDNYTRRKRNHDYCSPCHYHIIIKKNPNFPLWGQSAYRLATSGTLGDRANIPKYKFCVYKICT